MPARHTPPSSRPCFAPVTHFSIPSVLPAAAACKVKMMSVQPKVNVPETAGKFLLVSVCVHLLLGVGAVYWVVQKIETKRKLQFASGPPTANPSKRALEHKVSLQKKKNAGGSPAQAKRIAVTGLASKITLPDMPNIPTTSTQLVAGRMAGMGGAGFGSGLGFGNGSGMGVGGMGAGGAGLTRFGTRGGAGLIDTFYDLKQTRDGKPSSINTVEGLAKQLSQFTHGGWNQRYLDKFFKAPTTLRATHLMIPYVSSEEAPDAFGVKKFVQPSLWMVHYRGRVSPPESGTWRFVGGGDNFVIVRINGKVVLDCGFPQYDDATDFTAATKYTYQGFQIGDGSGIPGVPGGFAVSESMNLQANKSYDMEMVIGDDGGLMFFTLLIEKQGVQSERDVSGNPILPPFRLSKVELPKGNQPPYRPDGPIWRAQSDGGSTLNPNGAGKKNSIPIGSEGMDSAGGE